MHWLDVNTTTDLGIGKQDEPAVVDHVPLLLMPIDLKIVVKPAATVSLVRIKLITSVESKAKLIAYSRPARDLPYI
jgi:hypothetical protein